MQIQDVVHVVCRYRMQRMQYADTKRSACSLQVSNVFSILPKCNFDFKCNWTRQFSCHTKVQMIWIFKFLPRINHAVQEMTTIVHQLYVHDFLTQNGCSFYMLIKQMEFTCQLTVIFRRSCNTLLALLYQFALSFCTRLWRTFIGEYVRINCRHPTSVYSIF